MFARGLLISSLFLLFALIDDPDVNLPTEIEEERLKHRKKAKRAIAFANVVTKARYEPRHKPLNMKAGDKVSLRLHRGYTQPGIKSRKFQKQRIGPFKILEKMGELAYELDIPPTWNIHPVISVTHLEPAPSGKDPWDRQQMEETGPIQDEQGESEGEARYKIEKIIGKRVIRVGRSRKPITRYKSSG